VNLSIIIVNWNVRDLLRECIRSLRREMQMPQDQWELVVVDNDSKDGSQEMMRQEFPDVRLISSPQNVGFGRGNNAALPFCHGRYLLLLNPDTVVQDHAIDRLVAWMDAHEDVGAAGCRLLNSDGSFQKWPGGAAPTLRNVACHFLFLNHVLPERVAPSRLFVEKDYSADRDVDWVSGTCMLLRVKALEGKLFDEAFFMYGEDMELCSRIRKSGWRVVYTPAASVIHHQGRSLEQQRSMAVLTGPLKGPRAFFAMRSGGKGLRTYDFLTFTGFLIRWLGYTGLRVVRPRPHYRAKAVSSHRNMMTALGLLAGRR
jgi:N-acetylglucosaminyl-diphospho-decaprenol L-rhamnosyltransferase